MDEAAKLLLSKSFYHAILSVVFSRDKIQVADVAAWLSAEIPYDNIM